MKKLKFVGLVVIGMLGIAGMSTSVKADTQELDVQQMQNVKGANAHFKQDPMTNNHLGCSEDNCNIIKSGPQAAKYALDANVSYGACKGALLYDSTCYNATPVVCAYRYVYAGSTICTDEGHQNKQPVAIYIVPVVSHEAIKSVTRL